MRVLASFALSWRAASEDAPIIAPTMAPATAPWPESCRPATLLPMTAPVIAPTAVSRPGAGIGAGVGGLMGGMGTAGQNEKASKDRRDWERTEANKYAQNRNNYDRAFAACLEGRGYTVK